MVVVDVMYCAEARKPTYVNVEYAVSAVTAVATNVPSTERDRTPEEFIDKRWFFFVTLGIP